ncbi:MAG: hypothetical protein NTV49_00270 [Kiritimatiellaeota bacterium]|nr:hypothetical protein [Kiritimatiellota bacterium]
MSENLFEINAPGVDVEKLVAEIHAAVEKKTSEGVYADARIARAERTNLARLRDSDEFLNYYLQCLRDATLVDITDFPIRERRRLLGPALVRLKQAIWNLLKFYTYRLWSQQNQTNGLLVTAVEGLDQKYAAKVRELERRVQALESAAGVPASAVQPPLGDPRTGAGEGA